MDTALVKFLILWITCTNIVLTTSMALNEISNEDAKTRQKRSPASLFGFNLGDPVSVAKNTFSGIGNIFTGSRRNTHHNNYREPTQPYGQPYERNINTLSPINNPNRSGIPNSMAQYDFPKGDGYVWQQENESEGLQKTGPYKKQKPNTKPVPARNNEDRENTGDNTGNGDIYKQHLNNRFQKPQFNGGTTVDNSIDFVTETGEFETTTVLDQRILPPAAVASLLG